MATSRTRKRTKIDSPRRSLGTLHHPRGYLQDRVERAGPAHFGIACFDCHKDYTRWLLTDFFGNLLLPPQSVAHTRPALEQALQQLRQAQATHALHDLTVAIERTGCYHRPVANACRAAQLEVRIVHPRTTKEFRKVVDPDDKTDDLDLFAMQLATVNGRALLEHQRDDTWTAFLLLARQRRDLVDKSSRLRCQIHVHLNAFLPGLMDAVPDFWNNQTTWPIARHFQSAQEIVACGADGLNQFLRQQQIHFHRRSLRPILDWAAQALRPDQAAATHQRLAALLEEDRQHKLQQIRDLERELASLLCQTPYVRLLSCFGLNVVSVAEIAAELGPISHYANAQMITGRAGLRPSTYQSGKINKSDGHLPGQCNRSLRAALMRGGDCLLTCHPYFRALAAGWRKVGVDARAIHLKVTLRLCRMLWHMVAEANVFCHPKTKTRHYILDKLLTFHLTHDSAATTLLRDLEAALRQLPPTEYPAEATVLEKRLQALALGRSPKARQVSDLLPKVLAQVGGLKVESEKSGAPSPRTPKQASGPKTP
jgi:transposase